MNGIKVKTCEECQTQADVLGSSVEFWCWMFGCSLECDCYGRESAR